MPNPLVVVSGKNGQLGWEFQQLTKTITTGFDFLFTGREELDLSNPLSIPDFFNLHKPVYFINCAAYTAVDKAEMEKELALLINAKSLGVIADECRKHNCTLITISTDYVFDGHSDIPYQTDATVNPINYYGQTKRMGEKLALENNEHSIIIRTSWVYSSHGNNFVKTMSRLMREKAEIKVVSDQFGSPTNAIDLANVILQIIQSLENGNHHYGIYHYANQGIISWYDFAVAIKKLEKLPCEILPIPTTEFPTPAKRPRYTAMDTSKISLDFGIEMIKWEESLKTCIEKLGK